MNRWLWIAGVLLIGWLALSWLPGKIRGAFVGTTTDPRSFGLVQSGSTQPIVVGLSTKMYRDVTGNWRSKDAYLVGERRGPYVDSYVRFRVPAAAVTRLAGSGAPREAGQIGFELWSETLDPVAVDLIEQRRRCSRPDDFECHRLDSPMNRRKANGEYEVQFELGSNAIRNREETQRLYKIWAHRGEVTRTCEHDHETKSIAVVEMPAQDMTAYEFPRTGHSFDSCLLQTTRNNVTPGFEGLIGFVKRGSDLLIKFSARCERYNPDPIGRRSSLCEIRGRYRQWTLRIMMEGARAEKWDGLYDRIIRYLDDHLTEQFQPEN